MVDILAHDQGYHVALENGSDPVIASEYLHPSTPPRHSEQEEHGRQYIWGVVAVCVMILAGIGVLMTGLVP